jgi:hypothetical protein
MILHIIYLGAAIGFVRMPFLPCHHCARWSRCVFFTIAALFMFMAVLGLARDLGYLDLSQHQKLVLEHYMRGIQGFILGCVFVLLVSGNLLGTRLEEDVKDETVA